MCGFTVQLAEHRTDIAKVTGLIPIEGLIFFKSSKSNSSLEQQFRTELNECLSVEPLPRTIARYALVACPVAFSVFLNA